MTALGIDGRISLRCSNLCSIVFTRKSRKRISWNPAVFDRGEEPLAANVTVSVFGSATRKRVLYGRRCKALKRFQK